MTPLLALLFACQVDHPYIVEGTVVEVVSPTEVVVDHKEVKGLMGPMVMPFRAREASVFAGLEPGDVIAARFEIAEDGGYITLVRETGKVPPPARLAPPPGDAPIGHGAAFPAHTLALAEGGTLSLGPNQGAPVLLTFLYTRCPVPEMCPTTVRRLASVQAEVAGRARLIAVTLDPAHDTPEHLLSYGAAVGAQPGTWSFARVEGEALTRLALHAGLTVLPEGEQISHSARWLVISADGRLIERYDDQSFPLERVVSQLLTGAPAGPGGSPGTLTAPAP
jgi:protein SCO1/2